MASSRCWASRWPNRRSRNTWREGKPPSQSWKTFLRNHAKAIAAIDMCVVPTMTFDRLFAFLVLGHSRRQLLWFEVTRHPTAEWMARQITEAFPWASRRTCGKFFLLMLRTTTRSARTWPWAKMRR